MQELYSPKAYPEAIRKLILESGQIGMELANRWMLGWPKTVKSLIQSGEYQQAYKYQLKQERTILATEPNYSHLTRTELYQFMGQTLAPPAASM